MAAVIGKQFPEFSLLNQDGQMVTAGDFIGKWLVVYVYPKDDTPGCTIQGKSFTATKQEFDDANIAIVGVSEDDVKKDAGTVAWSVYQLAMRDDLLPRFKQADMPAPPPPPTPSPSPSPKPRPRGRRP